MRCGLLPPTRYDFYPRPPRGGRQRGCGEPQGSNQFLSTPSARRATDVKATAYNKALISIHALREEGDITVLIPNTYSKTFLSTPSARRATTCCRCGAACGAYFYPRPPRGGRRSAAGLEGQAGRFLSTPSARRATECAFSGHRSGTISIHALREEGDLSASYYYTFSKISIHALREEGDVMQDGLTRYVKKFLSTPSARRATKFAMLGDQSNIISIHALREEGDSLSMCRCPTASDFYPRPPRGGRHEPDRSHHQSQPISIHALREEGDRRRR